MPHLRFLAPPQTASRPRPISVLAPLAMIVALLPSLGITAEASTACERTIFMYGGELSGTNISGALTPDFNYTGVQGGVNVDGTYLPIGYQSSHLLMYMAGATQLASCTQQDPECQLQGGYGVGCVGGAADGACTGGALAQTSSLYVEKSDIYGFQPVFYTPSQFNIGTADYYSVFWTGEQFYDPDLGVYVGHYVAQVDNHTGNPHHQFGDAWLPQPKRAAIFVQAEGENFFHGFCPVINPTQWYGYAPRQTNQYLQIAVGPATPGWVYWSSAQRSALISSAAYQVKYDGGGSNYAAIIDTNGG